MINEEEVASQPRRSDSSPLLKTDWKPEEYKSARPWFFECQAISSALSSCECLPSLTLNSIVLSDAARSCVTTPLLSDIAMSVASTPPRISGDRKCWQCGESTRFEQFALCSDCHHSEGLKRAQSRAQIAPLEKNHVCIKCKSGPTISQFLLCDECLRKC